MSSLNLNAEISSSNPWVTDTAGLWSLTSVSTPPYVSQGEVGTMISAQSGTGDVPSARWEFESPLTLQTQSATTGSSDFFEELRFWLRSDRQADGSTAKPFYLAFEVANSSPGVVWRRFIPVKQTHAWELHRLWLGDMPDALRQSVRRFTLRSLDAETSFSAALGDLMATRHEPLQDVDTALLQELDQRFQVVVDGLPVAVRALVELPENPGDRTLPYILITPWSVKPQAERGGSGDLIDNYTLDGAYSRPPLKTLQLDYAIDVFAKNRVQKAYLMEKILAAISRRPFLTINGEPLEILSFVPSPEEVAQFTTPGRTPLFYRLTVHIETGHRQLQQRAVPFVLVGPPTARSDQELVSV